MNVEWFFLSHRLPIALGLQRAGCEVEVAASVEQDRQGEIEAHGFRFTRLTLSRGSTNPLRELVIIWRLYRLYRAKRPDVVHHVAVKPVLYGSLAARFARIPAVVNAVPGLGYLFSGTGLRRRLATAAYRICCRGPRNHFIFQNPEDREALVAAGVATRGQAVLIRGSGVDIQRFQPTPEPDGPPVVLMASRMLWDKGVAELIAAARQLRARGQSCRIVLAGGPDPENPRTVSTDDLRAWEREGLIEWWGHQEDMVPVFQQASIVVLPSYREGAPKVLLEACAMGRAIITTDVPGCREVVRHGENGLLVPPRDSSALGGAIEELVANPERRRAWARQAGRWRSPTSRTPRSSIPRCGCIATCWAPLARDRRGRQPRDERALRKAAPRRVAGPHDGQPVAVRALVDEAGIEARARAHAALHARGAAWASSDMARCSTTVTHRTFSSITSAMRARRGRPAVRFSKLGPGDSLATALLAHAHGAARTWLVDRDAYASGRIDSYRALAERLNANGPPESTAIPQMTSLQEMLDWSGGQYLVNGLGSLSVIPDGSVDLSFSHAGAGTRATRRVRRDHPGTVPRRGARKHHQPSHRSARSSRHEPAQSALLTAMVGIAARRVIRLLHEPAAAVADCRELPRGRVRDRVDRTKTSGGPPCPWRGAKLDREFAAMPDEELTVQGFDLVARKRDGARRGQAS